jgi:leucyl-tRNA synthetase
MMKPYDHLTIEKKWQDRWQVEGAFKAPELKPGDEKAYILDMFPYPSGAGLHVGHLLGYVGSDILARTARMKGKKVLHPMGWDAFGLPAENFAIKTNVHPAVSTINATLEYKRQFSQTGISYDWDREINTSLPEYYRWTQQWFTFLYKKGLAYRKDGMVNWCPNDQTVLANEQVVGGKCDRCGADVVQRQLNQWYFKITDYADRLIDDLEGLDWPEKIKAMQRNWIGRSTGAAIRFAVDGGEIEVFTTRPDTLYGATYLVLAPENALVDSLTTDAQRAEVEAYKEQVARSTELERTFTDRPKTGVWTGSYATNPVSGARVPVWIADYVLNTYGTGAIMAVPGHDERDYAFAKTFDLPIVQVVGDGSETLPYSGDGALRASAEFDGRNNREASAEIVAKAGGEARTTYRLRDWLVSRQRFWGSPIPIAYDSEGNEHLVPDAELPVMLPMNVEFRPDGRSPLTYAEGWGDWNGMKRETDTLDTFVCSSWYYLRFANPHISDAAFDKEAVKQWLNVDMYIGGAEHAVLHLLYARFFTKVLFDDGLIDFNEPFQSLRNQGMILGPDHNKMSKSKGNVINPDDVIKEYGADTLRAYEMFMGPFDQEKPWSTTGIIGVRRFLEKVWRLQERIGGEADEVQLRAINKAIARVSADIDAMRFNTAVSGLMECVNELWALPSVAQSTYMTLVKLLSPITPHIAEELWSMNGGEGFCSLTTWPVADQAYLVKSSVTFAVQVNGKVRASFEVAADADEATVRSMAADKVASYLDGADVLKTIFIPGKIVSYVLKS